MATNFLKLCIQGSANGVAFGDGVSDVGYASGVGKMYTWSVEGATGSGLLVGNGLRTCFLGSSTASFPLPSSVPQPWCHLGTLPLDSLPLIEHVADW